MKPSKKRSFILIFILIAVFMTALTLTACNKDPQDPGDPPIEIPDEGDPDKPDRTVTSTRLVTYEGPNLMTTSSALGVKVEGQELFVYDTRVNHGRIFTFSAPSTTSQVVIFDFEGKVNVEVEVKGATSISDVVVRPFVYNIQPVISGNKATFSLEYPANYSFEYKKNGEGTASENALQIFTSTIEETTIDPDNLPSGTIYIGPGVYEAGAIPVASNTTVYLAGGAYVFGQIRAELVDNLTITGRGIISGSIYQRTRANEYVLPIEIRSSTNVKISGITILDPAGWAVTLYKCDGVEVSNLKIITARANGDGISVQSCKNVSVKGGYVRTWDDSLVVKNTDGGSTDNVVFDNVTVWTDLAQSCEVGYETNGETMSDITFKNITIIHNFHKAAMSIHNADQADISKVTFMNITLEDGQMLGDNRNDGENDYLIDMTIAYSPEWSVSGAERGTIREVLFSNINVLRLADTVVCRMNGESPTANIAGVTINNVQIEGQLKNTAELLGISPNPYAAAPAFTSQGNVTGAKIAYPYILALADGNVQKTNVPTKHQNGLEVPDFAILDVEESYKGEKISTSGAAVTATHGTGDTLSAAYDDGSGSWETPGHTVANLTDSDRTTSWIPQAWTGADKEFIALTFAFGKKVKPGTVRVYFDENSPYVNSYEVSAFVKREESSANYSRVLGNTAFMASPADGNYFDIKLSSTLECVTLQLRFFRTSGMMAPQQLIINEIAFYPASLATNKVVIASDFFDVYNADNAVDGNDNTYWEASTAEGAYLIVDLGGTYTVSHINLHLPPLLTWEPREQTIEILISTDGAHYSQLVPSTAYLFDPLAGNYIGLTLDIPAQASHIKLQWSSNTSIGGYGAQLSEIYVYGH